MENNFLILLIILSITYLFTLVGVLSVLLKGKGSLMDILFSLSIGIMLYSGIDLMMQSEANKLVIISTFMLGVFLIYFINQYTKKVFKNDHSTTSLMAGLIIHKIPEGMALGSALVFLSRTNYAPLLLSLSIALQNIPEGLGVSMPVYKIKGNKKHAIITGLLYGLVETISGILGFVFTFKISFISGFLLSIASGAMLYVLFSEMFDELNNNKRKDVLLIFVLFSFILMYIISTIL